MINYLGLSLLSLIQFLLTEEMENKDCEKFAFELGVADFKWFKDMDLEKVLYQHLNLKGQIIPTYNLVEA